MENDRKHKKKTTKNGCHETDCISSLEREENKEVKRRIGIEGIIDEDIERKQLIWYVKIMNNDRLPKKVFKKFSKETKKREGDQERHERKE